MDWNKQAETMMGTWLETQKKVWEGWYDVMQGASTNNGTPFSFYPDMLNQWQQMSMQGLNAWTGGTDPIVRNLTQQFMTSQATMLRFLQATAQAWQAMAPKLSAGEDWQTVLQENSRKWFETMASAPASSFTLNQDMGELWQSYMKQWQGMLQAWVKPGQMTGMFTGEASELATLTNFHWDVYERTFGGLTDVPGLGYNRELNAKILRGFDTWVDVQRVGTEYRATLSRVWIQSFETFMEKLVKMSEKEQVIDSVQDLMNLWFDTVDETFTHMYVSEDYLELQRRLAGAAMTNKMHQQEIFEVFLKMLDMPTRSELDDAYKSMYELRKEVKALKKAFKEQQAGVQEKPKSSTASSSRKSTSTKATTTRKSSNRSKKSSSTADKSNGKAPETEAKVETASGDTK